MKRSLRSAGVRPVGSMQYHIVRSLAISLAIVLVITRSQAKGFAIRRADNWNSTTDLDTGESSRLEVRYDLEGATRVKALDSQQIEDRTNSGVNAITDFSKASDSGYLNNITLNNTVTSAIQVEDNDTTQQDMTEFSNEEANTTASNVDLTTSTIETRQEINITNISTPNETSNDIESTSPMFIETSTQRIYENDLTTIEISTRYANTQSADSFTTDNNNSDITSTVNIDVPDATQNLANDYTQQNTDLQQNTEIYESSTATINIITSIADSLLSGNLNDIVQSETGIDDEPTTETSPPTIESTSNKIDVETDNNNSDITSTVNIDVSDATQNLANNYTQQNTDLQQNTSVQQNIETYTHSSTATNDEPTTETSPPTIESTSNKIDIVTDTSPSSEQTVSAISTESSSENSTETGPDTILNVATDTTVKYLESNNTPLTTFAITEDQTEETFKIDALKDELETTMLPHWKIYKTINRKRPTTTSIGETTSTDIEMTKSETARISLERVLNNTPIPSLVQLKNDLLNAQEYSTKILDTMNETKTNKSDTPVLAKPSSTEQTATELETRTPKLEIVSSQRAGYLDNKKITTLEPPQLATAIIYEDKDVSNETESLSTMYESEIGDGEISELRYNNNSTGVESQSQLVEDAIKEELLMEKTLSENNLFKEEARQRDSPNPLLGNAQPSQHYVSKTPEISEDLLSVKPISPDKRKNNSIYVTSAVTYKPLKKLEVQHPKQFVRDPDDNSWRNESISSLGIVFKPKNASKSFTEVLKNKTTELSNMVDKGDKSNVPDLRVRLEKIAEVRKSKKKRINKYGDTVYSDYEESSGENANSSKEDTTSPIVPSQNQDTSTITPLPQSKTETDLTVNTIWKDKMSIFQDDDSTTEKLKKFYNMPDYYDATDDYDADYITLSKIDLKKFTIPFKSDKDRYSATRPPDTDTTYPVFVSKKPMRVTYMPDRQPTVQYFPPTKKASTPVTPKVSVNEYDDTFNQKVNMYAYKETPKLGYDVTFATPGAVQTKKHQQPTILSQKPTYTPSYQAGNVDKGMVLTTRPRITEPEPQGGFVPNDGTFNRASYVIKHYQDFINDAAKGNDDEKTSEYLPYTETPLRGVTMGEIPNFSVQKQTKPVEDYDYDTHFRKDIMTRFVDNFNQNSERFKVDFPILYNNSVVHRKEEQNGKVLASSSAFMKRLHETANPRSQFLLNVKPCNANCEALMVDLSPAYELHYYVPDQEEKEEMEPRSNTLPYRTYRL